MDDKEMSKVLVAASPEERRQWESMGPGDRVRMHTVLTTRMNNQNRAPQAFMKAAGMTMAEDMVEK